ncbi:MAG TPA: hypothetical protein VG735_16290 [Caulobacterales bacterium]|nr:hypothetical protein [Caulobacterales bacterium]
MRATVFFVALAFTPLAAFAQASSAPPAPATAAAAGPYAVPVETIELGAAKGRFLETAFSAGEYAFFSRTGMTQKGTGLQIMGSNQKRTEVNVDYRFTKGETALSAGRCSVQTKSFSGLWNTATNSLYTCQFGDLPLTDYALEIAVPNIAPEGHGFISIAKDDPDKYKVLKARMLYKGVYYEATPTELDPRREAFHARVAKGYSITQDGKAVGRIDFKEGFAGKGALTAPAAGEKDREAVIFLAAQLVVMPEANSPALR